MSSDSGHQSRFLWPRAPPVNGHLPALLSSVFASMLLSDHYAGFSERSVHRLRPSAPHFTSLSRAPTHLIRSLTHGNGRQRIDIGDDVDDDGTVGGERLRQGRRKRRSLLDPNAEGAHVLGDA